MRKKRHVYKSFGSQLRSRKYRMKLAELYSAVPNLDSSSNSNASDEIDIDSSSESRDHLSDEELP